MATKKQPIPLSTYVPKKDEKIYFYKGIRLMLIVPYKYRMPDYGYLKIKK